MIRVWTDGHQAGVLDRLANKGSTFAYAPEAPSDRSVSVTMPVRVQSWDLKFGLLPIFEMNLPEGSLREKLRRRFSKATGVFDDFDLLAIVGRTQIGRIRYSAMDQHISENVPFQSIDEILRSRREGGLFDYLLERFATHSGLSGVQPKVMVRGVDARLSDPKIRKSPSIQGATHIVKFWDAEEFPELAANEYFCLKLAKAVGLEVPHFELSDDGSALVIERFDLSDNGYLGFEDFCVLNALDTASKYNGGYETRIFRRLKEFSHPLDAPKYLEDLYRLFLLNCVVRNGDAHLKNFGVTYDSVNGSLKLAPVYDVVTTWPYIPEDTMALTINGSTRWPDRKALITLAQTRAGVSPRRAELHMERIADAMASVAPEISRYFSTRTGEVGIRMLDAWQDGIQNSFQLNRDFIAVAKPVKPLKMARSDGLLLEYLRSKGGSVTGSMNAIAQHLELPLSTFNASVKRLVNRKFVRKSNRSLILLPKEV
jgi:serine/threonine-protein kinase HipA